MNQNYLIIPYELRLLIEHKTWQELPIKLKADMPYTHMRALALMLRDWSQNYPECFEPEQQEGLWQIAEAFDKLADEVGEDWCEQEAKNKNLFQFMGEQALAYYSKDVR